MEEYELVNGALEEIRAERERERISQHEERQRVLHRACQLGLERNLTLVEHFLSLEDRVAALEGRA